MKLNYADYPYKSRRTAVFGQRGMVASSNSHATLSGIEILKSGGNCVDAAIAMAMVHVVVEPTSNGLGSDAFAILSVDDQLYGINASGYAPKNLTIKYLKDRGYKTIPTFGPLSADVPGAVAGWVELHRKFGKLPFEKIAQPAIKYAEEGFVLTPTIGLLWEREVEKYSKFKDDTAFDGFFRTFTQGGKAPETGTIIKLPHHGETLKEIAKTYGESFYRGELAEKIVKYLKSKGGVMEKSDLENYKAEWVDPISVNYKGYDIWELPPNGQGMVVLMALEMIKGMNLEGVDKSLQAHYQIEALKSAFADAEKYIGEPSRMKPTFKELLGEKYLEGRRREISDVAVIPKAGMLKGSSTIYLTCADDEGNMISFIQSNYKGFGSGVVVEGTGIALNDRACDFSFDESSPNTLIGGTRPYHTIIPGFLTKKGKALGSFGVMGAYMQPQGHLQILLRMIDEGFNPQAALDAPRWQWIDGKTLEIEEEYERKTVEELKKRGHDIKIVRDRTKMGRGQIILKQKGIYVGGTEPRTDGCVLGM
ncbi:gamma-glutamyltransferase [Peptoniphilus sp. ING2-D1G]|nr:gamma-glutamyltransferase [Peptoniphilus sp. ING2-D1G]